MTAQELVEVDERRLLRRLDELAQRGALPAGGIYRALYTPSWVAATELVQGWMKDANLLARRDAVGNVWGRMEGARGGRAIVTGSHIDTVRGGGALDGALGVVAGIEAVASLVARFGRPARILECVAICEEEGSRFDTNFWGARAIADRLEPDEATRVRDADGVTLADAMRGVGLDPLKAPQAVRRDIDTFVEL
ncbi:MAG TPA: M20/M25/M40 family metallo-hydrolase, partial [Candidatus Limnocylindria bacterium]|nr:M20/M25/M40 family metallo-hydrolase [Candidatus Limnocylindria bacterium]